eukprot:CAMPEP_0177632198 /NCGR_PEP_ID=MMETSP0447-20121125/2159_1 /TAXON_ID=0 /ORGANISM="Stygamoeba regulata, Strain BSH-02190019" /LENGTH=565 /DNA_ID=CAMNT_0019133741 /DNA_START=196 /DNA_END=1893 /DNA_ORIENTATION=+
MRLFSVSIVPAANDDGPSSQSTITRDSRPRTSRGSRTPLPGSRGENYAYRPSGRAPLPSSGSSSRGASGRGAHRGGGSGRGRGRAADAGRAVYSGDSDASSGPRRRTTTTNTNTTNTGEHLVRRPRGGGSVARPKTPHSSAPPPDSHLDDFVSQRGRSKGPRQGARGPAYTTEGLSQRKRTPQHGASSLQRQEPPMLEESAPDEDLFGDEPLPPLVGEIDDDEGRARTLRRKFTKTPVYGAKAPVAASAQSNSGYRRGGGSSRYDQRGDAAGSSRPRSNYEGGGGSTGIHNFQSITEDQRGAAALRNEKPDFLTVVGASLDLESAWPSGVFDNVLPGGKRPQRASDVRDPETDAIAALAACESQAEREALLDEVVEELRGPVTEYAEVMLRENLRVAHEELYSAREDMATSMEKLADDTKYQVNYMKELEEKRLRRNQKAAAFFARAKALNSERDSLHAQHQRRLAKETACSAPSLQRDLVNHPHLYSILDGEKGLARDHPHYEVVRLFIQGIALNRSWPEIKKMTMVEQMIRDLRNPDKEFGIGEIPLSSLETPRRFTYEGHQN